jgi:hypothetical protein
MAIRITEKEHWKNRIESRIDRRINSLMADDQQLFKALRMEAREKAIGALGISENVRRMENLRFLMSESEKKLQDLLLETRNEVTSKCRLPSP